MMNDMSVLKAIEIVEGYLDELSDTGYYDDNEFAEFETAMNIVLNAAKGLS